MPLNDMSRIKLAIPNKGRLKEPAVELLRRSGYRFRAKERALYATCPAANLTIIFLRAIDIPVLVGNGVIDIGITGQDLVEERMADVDELLPLGFGQCRLCVAASEEMKDPSLRALDGKTVATSFPRITENFFQANGVNVTCIELDGSVEIMIGLGLADAIVDLVETGDSLRANHLAVTAEIGTYQTALIGRKGIGEDDHIVRIRRRLEGILIADRYSILEYNVKTDRLREAETITPGFSSPTISKLEDPAWIAVKVMVKKKDVPDVMDRLAEIGAAAVFESSITNCRL